MSRGFVTRTHFAAVAALAGLMALAAYGAPAQLAQGVEWMRSLGLDVAEVKEGEAR